MKFVAYLVGILSIPICYVVLAYPSLGLFVALIKLSEFFGGGIWLVLPVSLILSFITITLSLWFGYRTTRFLLRRWSP